MTKFGQGLKKIGLYVLGGIIGLTFVSVITSVLSGPSPEHKLMSNTEPTKFTSAEHNFSVDFPGLPQISHDTLDYEGYDIPLTIYERSPDEEQSYMVSVNHYPSDFVFSDTKAALQGAANGAVQNTEGAEMVSTNFTRFLTYEAIDSEYTITDDTGTYTAYGRNFLKGNTLYSVYTFGATKGKFDSFVNSFAFTD